MPTMSAMHVGLGAISTGKSLRNQWQPFECWTVLIQGNYQPYFIRSQSDAGYTEAFRN